jgi:hypothetical protein
MIFIEAVIAETDKSVGLISEKGDKCQFLYMQVRCPTDVLQMFRLG